MSSVSLVLAERYKVLRQIGQGGMGVVFEAVHVHTGRPLAVKTLLARYVDDPVLVERFMREARATTAIGDPHVVEIVDIGRTAEGDVFMVMELLDGRELKRAIREDAPLPVARACHIAHQIAAVMGLAHAKGVVHRDLKPANVFLVPRDRDPDYVKVLDFGIAKLDRSLAGEAAEGQTMTRTGQIIGTPSYMSPEQLQGLREVDARSDVYAVGVILYQMLAGELPMKGDSIPDIFLKVMTTDPAPLRTVRPAVPEALAEVAHRALRRDPATRYADCAALAAALAPFAAEWRPGSAPTATDAVVPGAANSGAQTLTPSGLSAPVVVPTQGPSLDSLSGSVRASARPSPARTVTLAALGVTLALGAALALWRPWRAEDRSVANDAAPMAIPRADVHAAPVAPEPDAAVVAAARDAATVDDVAVDDAAVSADVAVRAATGRQEPSHGRRARTPHAPADSSAGMILPQQ